MIKMILMFDLLKKTALYKLAAHSPSKIVATV
jgi:hypothetical protein